MITGHSALFAAAIAAFALCMYVLLDGFDLGVGALVLFSNDEAIRDRMVDAIAPTWDGNETWLVLAGVSLFGAFPVAYSVLLPAFYLPIILMLMALGCRGVSIEFRFQTETWRRFWDKVFGVGSIVAALSQGLILGGAIQGVAVSGHQFSGGVLDFLGPFRRYDAEDHSRVVCGRRRFDFCRSCRRSTSTPRGLGKARILTRGTRRYLFKLALRGCGANWTQARRTALCLCLACDPAAHLGVCPERLSNHRTLPDLLLRSVLPEHQPGFHRCRSRNRDPGDTWLHDPGLPHLQG
jgi:hypothetical protein